MIARARPMLLVGALIAGCGAPPDVPTPAEILRPPPGLLSRRHRREL
ncbi:MAG: hypothetical protein R3A48_10810 [Polyangiales bacterium]